MTWKRRTRQQGAVTTRCRMRAPAPPAAAGTRSRRTPAFLALDQVAADDFSEPARSRELRSCGLVGGVRLDVTPSPPSGYASRTNGAVPLSVVERNTTRDARGPTSYWGAELRRPPEPTSNAEVQCRHLIRRRRSTSVTGIAAELPAFTGRHGLVPGNIGVFNPRAQSMQHMPCRRLSTFSTRASNETR